MTTTPAGWYPDPAGGPHTRWWDGTQWTDHVSDPTAPAAVLRAPEGTVTNTPWVWLIIALPLLPMLGLLTINWGALFDFSTYASGNPSDVMNAELALFLSPGYLAATLGGWVVYGLNAFFAYRDWRFLQKAGVPRPFHFAWVFLSSNVYTIGRAVVVKRRTGHGSAVLWATIASIVIVFVIVIVMMSIMFTTLVNQMPYYRG